jgi:hypothetical protein
MSQGSKRTILAAVAFAAVLVTTLASATTARAAGEGQPYDWQRFYYYPYVYYPHNFSGVHQYDNLYYRYPPERQIPVYRADWYNFYPTDKPYHRGHHFILDVF